MLPRPGDPLTFPFCGGKKISILEHASLTCVGSRLFAVPTGVVILGPGRAVKRSRRGRGWGPTQTQSPSVQIPRGKTRALIQRLFRDARQEGRVGFALRPLRWRYKRVKRRECQLIDRNFKTSSIMHGCKVDLRSMDGKKSSQHY